MAIRLLVRGEVRYGHYHAFLSAVEDYKRYRERRGWVVPEVWHALSGPMNTVLMVYTYPGSAAFEAEERPVASGPEYARVASAMAFR